MSAITDLEVLKQPHKHCDDSWYCCPACPNEDHPAGSCGGDFLKHGGAVGRCACGADVHNARIDALIAAERAIVPTGYARQQARAARLDEFITFVKALIRAHGSMISTDEALTALDGFWDNPAGAPAEDAAGSSAKTGATRRPRRGTPP